VSLLVEPDGHGDLVVPHPPAPTCWACGCSSPGPP
jgi:hypothetical protein